MATIRREFRVDAPLDEVWGVFRDVGAVHTRLAPGFVTACKMDGADRIVTFANGLTARELIVDVDDRAHRLAYSARSERLAHHNASFQLLPDGDGCKVVWIADVLPNAAAESIGAMMEQGCAVMKKTLERK